VSSVRRTGALLLLVGLVATACTSSHNVAAPPVSPPTQSSAPPVSTPVAPSSPPPASTSAPTTSAPVSTPAVPPPTSPPPRSTCTSIAVRVLPGGAEPGQEIAALQFTNTGNAACVLVGYPSVTLLLHGRRIGLASQPATPGVPSSRQHAAGETAESLLHDYTQTCQAPLSDSVKVSVPGSSQTYLRADMQLRACVIRVDKLGATE
jgi:hypothetical protein